MEMPIDRLCSVFLQLQDMIEGITEVVGEVGANPRQIQCIHYVNHGNVDFGKTSLGFS